jgi:hypothetical protein
MALFFTYQYNGDSSTRDTKQVPEGTPVPKEGEVIELRKMTWMVEGVTTIGKTSTDKPEKDTEYVIDLMALG